MKFKFLIPTILFLTLMSGFVLAQSLWFPDDVDSNSVDELEPVDDTWGARLPAEAGGGIQGAQFDNNGILSATGLPAFGITTSTSPGAGYSIFRNLSNTNWMATSTITIAGNGYVGIGTDAPIAPMQIGSGADAFTSPAADLYINNDGRADIVLRNSTNNIEFSLSAGASKNFFIARGSSGMQFSTEGAGQIIFDQALGADEMTINTGAVGIMTAGADRALDVLDASNPQLRLTHTDGSVFTDFKTDSGGDLIITPSGDTITLYSSLNPTAGILRLSGQTTAGAGGLISGIDFYNRDGTGDAPNIGAYIRVVTDDGTNRSTEMVFATDDTVIDGEGTIANEAMRIDRYGFLGVNTTLPVRRIDILDASNPQLRLTHTDGSVFVDMQANSSGDLSITGSGGKVGIGTTTPATLLSVSNASATSTMTLGEGGSGFGGCLKIRDVADGGWTYCRTSGGTMTCNTNSCE